MSPPMRLGIENLYILYETDEIQKNFINEGCIKNTISTLKNQNKIKFRVETHGSYANTSKLHKREL